MRLECRESPNIMPCLIQHHTPFLPDNSTHRHNATNNGRFHHTINPQKATQPKRARNNTQDRNIKKKVFLKSKKKKRKEAQKPREQHAKLRTPANRRTYIPRVGPVPLDRPNGESAEGQRNPGLQIPRRFKRTPRKNARFPNRKKKTIYIGTRQRPLWGTSSVLNR